MKKTFSFLILLLILSGCSRSINVHLPGISLPPGGIDKTLPKVTEAVPATMSADLEKALQLTLENKIVPVYGLTLYQNGDTWAPMMSLISNAEKFLYLNFLSFTCDGRTEPLVKALEEKAEKQKTDVRLIVNKGFSLLSRSCLKRLENSGVKIVKAKSHASYMVNDKKELMIGSQSIARMFFNADGFNSLDRDMMIYARGIIASFAVRDFASTWIEEKTDETEVQKIYLTTLEWQDDAPASSASRCVFLSQRPKEGMRDYETAIFQGIRYSQKEIRFSGVKVNAVDSETALLLREKSTKGVPVIYQGNGYLSGNGELTMVFNEWIDQLGTTPFAFVAPVIEGIKLWDNRRTAIENKKYYDKLVADSAIQVWTYFNFIHHKVWLFDGPAFIIGSANLDQKKFSEVTDAGLLCADPVVYNQLKAELMRDQRNSVRYVPPKKGKK